MLKLLLVCLTVCVAAPAMAIGLCNDKVRNSFKSFEIVPLADVPNIDLNFAYASEDITSITNWDSATMHTGAMTKKNGEDTVLATLSKYMGIVPYGKPYQFSFSNSTLTESRGVCRDFPEPKDVSEIITCRCKSEETLFTVLCRDNGKITVIIATTKSKLSEANFNDCKEKANQVAPGVKLVELKQH